MHRLNCCFGVLAIFATGIGPVLAQKTQNVLSNQRGLAVPQEVLLNTGTIAGMPPESSFTTPDGKRAYRNISRATITPILPRAGAGTGAAVLILPGGAFSMLSMDNEGWPVARWFADHGIAAFVVKYRLNPTALTQSAFDAEMAAQYKAVQTSGVMPDLPVPPQAVDDAKAALRWVRRDARRFGIDPARIGMVGFSAGAMTTLSLVTSNQTIDEPAFIASIYPPMKAIPVPASAPPMFVSIAADDPLFGAQGFGLIEAWRAAGKPVELHYYQNGGHGFGLGDPAKTASDWKDSFLRWMRMNGFLTAK